MLAEAARFMPLGRGDEAPLDWARDSLGWPLREFSRFVADGELRWHVQQLGTGPVLLLVHGTGASTHSWRTLAPLLAQRFAVTAIDLPGHGFTAGTPRGGMSLPAISAALGSLLRVLALPPALAIGHSAGAAIVCRMALDGLIAPRGLVSLNGALLRPLSLEWKLFTPLAQLLALSPLPSRFFAWAARDRVAVERLIASTGSTLQPVDVELYSRLVRSPGHADGALRMMAHWDLDALERELPRLKPPLTMIVGAGDRTVPPGEALRVQRLLPATKIVTLPGLGHLAHEERADLVADAIFSVAEQLEAHDPHA
jgi:magnesium chelatase accessory protein